MIRSDPQAEFHRRVRWRVGFFMVSVGLAFALIAFRLVQLQVLVDPALEALAQRQYSKTATVAPYRHPLYDRNGHELAVSIPSPSVYARPKLVRQKRRAARVLAKVLGQTPARWLEKLDSSRPFVWLERQVGAEAAARLAAFRLSGIFVEPENRRVYPNGEVAAHVLGFTDIDGNGITGIELSLNRDLLAPSTKLTLPRDGRGTTTYIDRKYGRAEPGDGAVSLTLDRRLQSRIEDELQKALTETGAATGIAIVMDPHTGEIYALAQRPGFDPNHFTRYDTHAFLSRATSALYEPGSTLKVLFTAEALERGLLRPGSSLYCGNGKVVVGKETLREADGHRFSWLSVAEVLRLSSNVGAVRIAQLLGPVGVMQTLDRFGLTAKTGIQLPGETTSPPRARRHWIPVHVATAGFGQGVAATPLQMVVAFAPFANGGYLVRPTLLSREGHGARGRSGVRLLSRGTVDAIKEMLISVTEAKDGTGTAARVPGVRVAGKTGTGQKFEPGVGYRGGKYFSSFIGFLPADRPELLIGVMLDEPQRGYYAAKVVAPLFSRIAEMALHVLGKRPERSLATRLPIASLLPRRENAAATARTEVESAGDGKWRMPDLGGLTVRETVRVLGGKFGDLRVRGSGYLLNQSPKAGSVVGADVAVVLQFNPSG